MRFFLLLAIILVVSRSSEAHLARRLLRVASANCGALYAQHKVASGHASSEENLFSNRASPTPQQNPVLPIQPQEDSARLDPNIEVDKVISLALANPRLASFAAESPSYFFEAVERAYPDLFRTLSPQAKRIWGERKTATSPETERRGTMGN